MLYLCVPILSIFLSTVHTCKLCSAIPAPNLQFTPTQRAARHMADR